VRQAMSMLTNRQAICDQVYLGYATVANGPFSPLSKQFDPKVQALPYDPDRAMALLKQAGFSVNSQGLVLDPSGQQFHFKLTYPSGQETYERVVLLLKDNFAKAGVVMEPDPVDWPILLKKLNDRDFDAISLRWTGAPESDIYQEFHSSQIKDQGDNFCSYINPELDKLIAEARTTVDADKRMPLWQKCHEILHEDQPYTFLTCNKALVFYDKRIRNIKPSKLGLNVVSDDNIPYPWFVPTAEQKWKN
jgi:peptide/nickel transport system substrate-binding protein